MHPSLCSRNSEKQFLSGNSIITVKQKFMLRQIEKFCPYRAIVFYELNRFSHIKSRSYRIIANQYLPPLVVTDTETDPGHIMIETELRIPGSLPIGLSLRYRYKLGIMFHLQSVTSEHLFPEAQGMVRRNTDRIPNAFRRKQFVFFLAKSGGITEVINTNRVHFRRYIFLFRSIEETETIVNFPLVFHDNISRFAGSHRLVRKNHLLFSSERNRFPIHRDRGNDEPRIQVKYQRKNHTLPVLNSHLARHGNPTVLCFFQMEVVCDNLEWFLPPVPCISLTENCPLLRDSLNAMNIHDSQTASNKQRQQGHINQPEWRLRIIMNPRVRNHGQNGQPTPEKQDKHPLQQVISEIHVTREV